MLFRYSALTFNGRGIHYDVGYEVVIWMGMALGYGHYDIGWRSTSTLGPIGTGGACARALGLSDAQIANTMAPSSCTCG